MEFEALEGHPLLPDGLSPIVSVLRAAREGLAFSILDFEGVLKETANVRYEELRSEVVRSSLGFRCTWDELASLAESIDDVFDFLLVGYPRMHPPPVRASFDELASSNDVVIEVCDSSQLRMSFSDDALAELAGAMFD